VDRLVNRHLHFVACRICEFLKMKPNRVLIHWACCKVKRTLQLPDEVVRDMLFRKMSKCPGISYVEVAQAAYDVGRKELATLILDDEPSPREQIKLLMQMGSNDRALVKALEAGDTDWIYLVLLHLMKEYNLEPGPRGRVNQDGAKQFVQMIRDKPVACDLFVQYARSQDLQLLLFFYHYTQNNVELARMTIHEAYKQNTAAEKAKILKETQVLLAAHPAESGFYAKATEEQIKLLAMGELEQLIKGDHAHMPLSDIIFQLIKMGHMNKALKLKSDFKVPDKRFWWLKLKALAASDKWTELEKFSKEKRSPIGYEPFVQICLEHGRLAEARRFCTERIDKPSMRAEYFIKMEDWQAATENAIAAKDIKLLRDLIPKTKEFPSLLQQIQGQLAQLE